MQSETATIWSMRFWARRDLRVRANADSRLNAYFNVLDPITRQSYRVGELEHSLLSMLNGTRTLAQVLKLLRQDRHYESLSENQLLLTVEQLQRIGLVRASQFASGSRSLQNRKRGGEIVRAQGWLSGLVSWQLRGLQPDAWLSRLVPYTNAIFSGAAVVIWLMVALVTCLGVLLEFPRLSAQSNAWQWIVHPAQGSALFVVFLVTRALHELGHAVVCKRHGVRCPDIGLFVVLGAPCVYCDVSESWQLPNRWQRASVAAAGMYVELIIATLAAWIWMVTIDGPVNTIALQTMFVCSVSTVLINANPLMRFDGYYILSDMLDESNLRGRADAIAETRLYRMILGKSAVPLNISLSKASSTGYEHLLCLFSWMGWCYRAGLSLAIAGLLVSIYESWNFAWVGRLVAVSILVSWWGIPSVKLAKNLIQMAGKTNKRWRLAFVATVFVGCVGFLPFPYRQFASGWLQPESMRGVYAPATGILEWSEHMPPSGSYVEEGTPLMSIYDKDAEIKVTRTTESRNRIRAELDLQRQSSSKEVDSLQRAFEFAEKEMDQAKAERDKLTLTAKSKGQYIAMPATPPTGPWSVETDSLQRYWADPTQAGRLIQKGTMLATVCSPQRVAVIPLSDSQQEWVASGTEVRLRCVERGNIVYTCKVGDVVALEDVDATWTLMNSDHGQIVPVSSRPSKGRKHGAAQAALIPLPSEVVGTVGARVEGVFIAPSQTVASLCNRWLQQNIRWLAD